MKYEKIKNAFLRMASLLILLSSLSKPIAIHAQESQQKFLLRQISFEGNHRTKSSRILREMEFNVGDSLTLRSLTRQLKVSKDHIINTGLFTDVTTNIFFDEENIKNVRVHITVKEGLFFIPIPIIELADRNFNVWWTEHNRSIKFLNLGLNLKMKNISGNADELNLLGQWGYDRKFIVNYESPYFDADRKWNFNFRTYYASNKELVYATADGNPQYIRDDDDFLRSRLETGMSFAYRPGINTFYRLSFGYFYNSIADEVFELNQNYLANRKDQQYSQIKMEYTLEKRNNKYLATEGLYLHAAIAKNGIVNSDHLRSWEFEGDFYYHYKFNDNWFWNNGVLLRGHEVNSDFPYFNLYQLGTDPDYLRGYEYYQIEGANLGIYKTSLMRRVFDRSLNLGKVMPFTNYKDMDTKVYLSLNMDYGYVVDDIFKTSDMVNKNLFGGGLGLNILLYNQFSCSFEASLNQRKELGLFFHLNRNFK